MSVCWSVSNPAGKGNPHAASIVDGKEPMDISSANGPATLVASLGDWRGRGAWVGGAKLAFLTSPKKVVCLVSARVATAPSTANLAGAAATDARAFGTDAVKDANTTQGWGFPSPESRAGGSRSAARVPIGRLDLRPPRLTHWKNEGPRSKTRSKAQPQGECGPCLFLSPNLGGRSRHPKLGGELWLLLSFPA